MSDSGTGNGNGNGSNSSNGMRAGQFALENIYTKDLSFEAPGAPEIFATTGDTQINMNLRNSHRALGDDRYEVLLHVSLHATAGDKTAFVVELDQAGVFLISGLDADILRQVVSSQCPAALYPYARETIAAAIGRGGFPPVHLQPINFDALLAQAEEEHGQVPS